MRPTTRPTPNAGGRRWRSARGIWRSSPSRRGEGGRMRFYVGLHHPHDAGKFERCMVSVNALRNRQGPFPAPAKEWMMDSGAFTELSRHGHYRETPAEYGGAVKRWGGHVVLIA